MAPAEAVVQRCSVKKKSFRPAALFKRIANKNTYFEKHL